MNAGLLFTGMADLAETILSLLADREGFNSLTLAEELSTDHQIVVGAIKSLHSQGDVSICSICCLIHDYLSVVV